MAGVPPDRIAYVTGHGPLRNDEVDGQKRPQWAQPPAGGAPQLTSSCPLSEAEMVEVLSRYLAPPRGGGRVHAKVQPSQEPIPWAGERCWQACFTSSGAWRSRQWCNFCIGGRQ